MQSSKTTVILSSPASQLVFLANCWTKQEWPSGSSIRNPVQRQRLLKQYNRLPGDPKLNVVQSQDGEILVAFYNHVLHYQPEPDEDLEDAGERLPSENEDEDEDEQDTEEKPPSGDKNEVGQSVEENLSSDDEDGDEQDIGDEKPICRPVPLQHLYKLEGNKLEMLQKKDLLRYLPGSPNTTTGSSETTTKKHKNAPGNLSIMYAIT